jgi:hypothetical protein
MQFMEAAKKSGFFKKDYAALVTLVANEQQHFLQEFTDAINALMNWKKHRKSEAKTIAITVVGSSNLNDWVEFVLTDAFSVEPELVDIKDGTSVSVALLNKGTTPAKEFDI